jgi:hypothetical protein
MLLRGAALCYDDDYKIVRYFFDAGNGRSAASQSRKKDKNKKFSYRALPLSKRQDGIASSIRTIG